MYKDDKNSNYPHTLICCYSLQLVYGKNGRRIKKKDKKKKNPETGSYDCRGGGSFKRCSFGA